MKKGCYINYDGDEEKIILRDLRFIHKAEWTYAFQLGVLPYFFQKVRRIKKINCLTVNELSTQNIDTVESLMKMYSKLLKSVTLQNGNYTFLKNYRKMETKLQKITKKETRTSEIKLWKHDRYHQNLKKMTIFIESDNDMSLIKNQMTILHFRRIIPKINEIIFKTKHSETFEVIIRALSKCIPKNSNLDIYIFFMSSIQNMQQLQGTDLKNFFERTKFIKLPSIYTEVALVKELSKLEYRLNNLTRLEISLSKDIDTKILNNFANLFPNLNHAKLFVHQLPEIYSQLFFEINLPISLEDLHLDFSYLQAEVLDERINGENGLFHPLEKLINLTRLKLELKIFPRVTYFHYNLLKSILKKLENINSFSIEIWNGQDINKSRNLGFQLDLLNFMEVFRERSHLLKTIEFRVPKISFERTDNFSFKNIEGAYFQANHDLCGNVALSKFIKSFNPEKLRYFSSKMETFTNKVNFEERLLIIASLKNLTSLNMGCKGLTVFDDYFVEIVIRAISKLTKLKMLTLKFEVIRKVPVEIRTRMEKLFAFMKIEYLYLTFLCKN